MFFFSLQNWNHYSILPSTPRSTSNTPPSPKTLANAKPKLPNPYDSLSHEAQRFVENITDMGFPRARVARAVQKLGNDDKQVRPCFVILNFFTPFCWRELWFNVHWFGGKHFLFFVQWSSSRQRRVPHQQDPFFFFFFGGGGGIFKKI